MSEICAWAWWMKESPLRSRWQRFRETMMGACWSSKSTVNTQRSLHLNLALLISCLSAYPHLFTPCIRLPIARLYQSASRPRTSLPSFNIHAGDQTLGFSLASNGRFIPGCSAQSATSVNAAVCACPEGSFEDSSRSKY